MKIIAHRGFWLQECEKNTPVAFLRAIEHGFGIETDFRDFNGQLVVAHDLPINGVMTAVEFNDLLLKNPFSSQLAINIKSDGLHALITSFIGRTGLKNYFVFDMALPDMRGYLKNNTHTFTRLSEYEPHPHLLNDCKGVWLDAFESEWYDAGIINSLLNQNKQVAIVSSELHGRCHMALWDFVKKNNFHRNDLIAICTDFPLQAKEYFDGQD